ncbi:MAG: hypothetical protein IPP60_01995 [Sphingobacteriales bacterium]|jgi:hypothetical protein|nr:hypothetical protein [Sphingobacteriales bacterium]HNY56152.1 hypothetical protein [Chitinophagales bacterium]
MRTSTLYLFIAIILISGCARPYRKISMSSIPFINYREESKISYAVRQGVLYNMKDYFFARRENKKNVSLVAFKIVNKTDLPLNINDLQFTCGATVPISTIPVIDFYNTIKQKPGAYWAYSALGVVYPKPTNKSESKTLVKDGKLYIPLPFGVFVGAANFGFAYSANKKMLQDFQLLDLSNRVIQPHDSIQGILTFKNVANCGDIFVTVKE